MSQVLVVSAESRLVEAVESNLAAGVTVRAVEDASDAQIALLQESFLFTLFDYSSVEGESWETFVGIDNVLRMENSFAVLCVRKPSAEADGLEDQLESVISVIDLSRGRPQFDDKIRLLCERAENARTVDDPSISSDRILRKEVDLPALRDGSLVDLPLARVLYTLHQRKEPGVIKLRYSTHELSFGTTDGDIVFGGEFDTRRDLLGAFSWSHGHYDFLRAAVSGETVAMLGVIAEGCREHIRQRAITEVMTPVMRRYPVKTNLWEERKNPLKKYEVLQTLLASLDGSTNWEKALSALGQQVTDGFRAAYFAIQTDITHTIESPGFIGIAVQYSREVLRAREEVDRAEVEKTKAFRAASGEGASQLQRELGVHLKQMRDMTPHEIFGVWEGCGREVVQDRFYVLVKEHHPDVYGGNTSSQVRSLAQDIFILIKQSYQKLLAEEKKQTVPPPPEFQTADEEESEAKIEAQKPARQRLDTPRLDEMSRAETRRATPTPRGRTRSSASRGSTTTGAGRERAPSRTALSEASEISEPAEEKPKVDVKKGLAMLSGYRKKQKHRERRRSYMGKSVAEEDPPTTEESSEALVPPQSEPQPEPEPEPDPNEVAEEERKAKLDHLLKRAQSVGHPDAPDPARDFWNKGYKAFKETQHDKALQYFQKAYDLEPESGPNLTFYAYTRFLAHPDTADECMELLRKALETGDRQSAPDACLFLGHIYKSRGEMKDAVKYYQRALRLNPTSREAKREIRLAEKRGHANQKSDPAAFIKNLFNKK